MRDELKLSEVILFKIPEQRRMNSYSNLKWVARNIRLSNNERQEVVDLIREMDRRRAGL